MRRGLLHLIFVIAISTLTSAGNAADLIEPLRFQDDVKNSFVEAPGIATDIDVHVEGTIARTTVTQYFLNDTEQWQEGLYQFPLPDDAAVDSLTMMIGNRRVIGFVAPKAEAKAIYEAAKAEGQATGLVDQQKANLFKTSVANIPPRSLIAIEIQYQSDVRLDDRKFSLRIPLAITPRYERIGDEQLRHLVTAADQVWAEEVVDRLALTSFEGGNNPVDLSVELTPGFSVQSIESGSHVIETKVSGGGDAAEERHEISLAADVTPGNRDFTLEWTPRTQAEPYQALFSEEAEDAYYSHFLMMVPPLDQEGGEVQSRPKRQVTFIIDVSGSMDGPSIRQAKKALLLALDDLGENDLFNVIAFNDGYWKIFSNPAEADGSSLEAAKAAVEDLRADGGTQMMPPIIEALTEPEASGYLRQIVFITDGAIGYEDQVAATIKKLAGNARFFAIGIGSAPNVNLLRHIAMAGRGSFAFIDDVNNVERELSATLRKMTAPVLTDIKLDLPPDIEAEILPERLPDLFAGEPISIAMKSAAPLKELRIQGLRDGKTWERTVTAGDARSAEGTGKIFARRKIQALTFDGLGVHDPAIEAAITEIAIQHQLVSGFTSLIAVDEAILRPSEKPILQKRYDPTLPLGWQEDRLKALEAEAAYRRLLEDAPSGNGIDLPDNELLQQVDLPQTATGFQLYVLAGLLSIFAASCLLVAHRRTHDA